MAPTWCERFGWFDTYDRLEQTWIGNAIRESLWLFPAVEAVHLLSLAMLGGAVLVVDLRLFGVDGDTVYFQHVLSGEALVLEADTLVLALGHRADGELEAALRGSGPPLEVLAAGDCVAPRSAEEAVLEGLRIGRSI